MASNAENLKKRNVMTEEEQEALLEKIYGNYDEDADSDDELPYGGKVYLARKAKPDSWACIAIQVNSSSKFLNRRFFKFNFSSQVFIFYFKLN